MQSPGPHNCAFSRHHARAGFTLVELLIAMVVVAIVGGAVITNYISQQRAAVLVREMAQLQQQLRGAIYVMEDDLRLAGFDPTGRGGAGFGITDIKPVALTGNGTDAESRPALQVARDWLPRRIVRAIHPNAGEDTNGNGVLDAGEQATYFLRLNDRGATDLMRRLNDWGGAELVAENIEHIFFAFAYEDDAGNIAHQGNDIIWTAPGANSVNEINMRLTADLTLQPMAVPVPLDRVRMVRVWLLARAPHPSSRFVNTEPYAMPGLPEDVRANGFGDGFRRRMLVRTIDLRNMNL
ncbi:prepilin-type N-terminal cleavage/methylation domain-containing protein [Desulfatitalea alkaliphila]|uniref:Prepilin-type N-terminal cleavage/methylation domain-containing protein n=1 Tax=Desulfatitalea alkaliphila TaxID=2929485 RepID=A0AA41R1W8_9BACT|nr:prepilin-type N-terminal cleavage/methylation domain-containing protein [Desulfatitalea alkaliphila]MCJ8499310.1 prepilin-type N-terminal cleavage/methylation domain-containing protein [Desulfatitalea alkaliphila]